MTGTRERKQGKGVGGGIGEKQLRNTDLEI